MKTILLLPAFLLAAATFAAAAPYLSPTRMPAHPVPHAIYVLLSTADSIAVVDPATEKVTATYPLGFAPSDLAIAPSPADPATQLLYITEYSPVGKLHIYTLPPPSTLERQLPIENRESKIENPLPIATIDVGAYPAAIALNHDATRAYIANQFSNDLSIIDLVTHREIARLPMLREPKSLAISPDGKLLAIGNLLPLQSALDRPVSARVTLVDTQDNTILANIPLADGTQSIEDICFSKNGGMLFVSHILSRYALPTTQVDRGWMNTNAVSIINIPARKYYTTLLLDDIYLGAANPRGMTLSPDGNTLYVATAGTHELIALSLPAALAKIKNLPNPADAAGNLTLLVGAKTRIPLLGKGANHVLALDNKLYTTDYFSAGLTVIDLDTPISASAGGTTSVSSAATSALQPFSPSALSSRFIKLGDEPAPDKIRRGELYFSNASNCFQQWQSCITCHPGVRADGLNWDLINDGIGNPKNTKSMLYAHATPPSMITGIRADAKVAVRAGLRYIQFVQLPDEYAQCIDEYLMSLRPVPSPHLINGQLSEKARRGEKLFARANCATCHSGQYYTDGKKYDVGTGVEESAGVPFVTPTLREVWRTAPYLYNGSAVTMKEVLTKYNKSGKHGETSKLTDDELDALAEYILSL